MGELRGPRGGIGYERDDLGFPSIEARDLEEASWACGWFHAHDRLVQVQLMLAIGQGRACALLGDHPLARHIDRMTRIHRFTDDLDEQVAKLSAEVKPVIDAYATGFDAGAKARGWPLLLRAVGIKRRPFRARDVMLIYRVVLWFGLNQLVEMATLIAGELVASGAPARGIGMLLGDAATAEEIAGAPRAAWPAELSAFAATGVRGSNGIAIAGARSASGGALLAADPHMEIARIPPVLYATHATHGGGEYMQGLHVPGLWYPSFGRTRHVGWTYTYGHVQSADVRVVRCRNGEMHDGTAWRALARRTSTVSIKGKKPETWAFWDGPLGTIVGDAGSATETALPCVQWSGAREAYRDANAARRLVDARNVDEAAAASRDLGISCLDAVLADRSGRIAHVVAGRMDARPASSRGVVPRAPDGPIVSADEATRPVTIDPPSGWIVSANARMTEAGGLAWTPVPESPSRRDRLSALVGSLAKPTLDDLARCLLDPCDAAAARILPVWAPHLPDHPRATSLVAWAAAQSPVAAPGANREHFAELALWYRLYEQTARAVLRDGLGRERADTLLDELTGGLVFAHHLDALFALESPDLLDATALKKHLATAWPAALADAAKPEHALPMAVRFKNAVFAGKLGWLFDSKPIEILGGTTTPNQTTSVAVGPLRMTFGGAGRYLADLSTDGGWYCMSGGASERRFGVGYGKGLDDWARGRFRPLGAPAGPAPRAR